MIIKVVFDCPECDARIKGHPGECGICPECHTMLDAPDAMDSDHWTVR